jgi:diguanylate cyclase (GGDEF)-like protein
MLGLRTAQPSPSPSPLEGLPLFRAQQAESDLRRLGRREWWLWLSAFFVTALSGLGLLLSSFRSLFLRSDHFYEIRPDQARWAIMCLLLLFNGWLLYRQWTFRRQRRQLSAYAGGSEPLGGQISSPAGFDALTGLYTRASIEQPLGKEIARARRQNAALSLATIHIDDLAQLNARHGSAAMDTVLKEFARRLKKACRNCDFVVRLASDNFVLVLPECNLGEVQLVLNRLGPIEMTSSGQEIKLTYTTGWADLHAGDLPADLLKRASELLRLYDAAAKDASSSTVSSR